MAVTGCGRGTVATVEPQPRIVSFAAQSDALFVGDSAILVAVFENGAGSLDGLGPVESGQPFQTPPLSRTTTFTLKVGDQTAQVTVHASYRNRFRTLGDAATARGAHLAGALPDGSAIFAGGHSADESHVPDSDSSGLFDLATEKVVDGPALPFPVLGPGTASAQLLDGTLLLVGAGPNAISLGAAEPQATLAFDPSTRKFVQKGNTVVRRQEMGVIVTALADGGALLTGGASNLNALAATEHYDRSTGQWTMGATLHDPRLGHSATLLADGRVLLAGGIQCCKAVPGGIAQFVIAGAEVYDPAAGVSTPTGSLAVARAFHSGTLLPDGRVLITGGLADDEAAPPTAAEIWDPRTGQFAPAGDIGPARLAHAAVALTDGRVLLVGGTDPVTESHGIQETFFYDPAANSWSPAPDLVPAAAAPSVTMLANGKVLVFGGETSFEDPVATTAIFE
jgi:hypothetical protein